MPDCQRLQLLSINSSTLEAGHNRGQVNKKSKQDKSKTNQNSKINLSLDVNDNQEVYYLLAELKKRVRHGGKCKITKELHNT